MSAFSLPRVLAQHKDNQEQWIGECYYFVAKSFLSLLQCQGLWSAGLFYPWDFPDKNTGMGCHSLLQGIFPTQGSNLCFLHWQTDSLPLSHWEAQRTWIIEMGGDPSWKGLKAQKGPDMVADKQGQRAAGCGPVSILGGEGKNGNESEHHRDWKPQRGQLYGGFGLNPPPPLQLWVWSHTGKGSAWHMQGFSASSACMDATVQQGAHWLTEPSLLGQDTWIQLPHAGTPASGKCPAQGVVYKR